MHLRSQSVKVKVRQMREITYQLEVFILSYEYIFWFYVSVHNIKVEALLQRLYNGCSEEDCNLFV